MAKISYADYIKKLPTSVLVAEAIFGELYKIYPSDKLSKFCETTSGGTPLRSRVEFYNGNIPWLKSGELNDGSIINVEEYISELGLKNSSAKLHPNGTLLLAMYGATAGRVGILNLESSTNQAVCALFPNEDIITKSFLFWFLRQHRYKFIEISKGGAQPNISQKVINDTLIVLPPLNVQKQIVNVLEFIEKENKLDLMLIPEEFYSRIHSVFTIRDSVENTSTEITHQLDLIKNLRQAFLREAMQGLLVSNETSENKNGADLLAEIQAEKALLIKEKKIKKPKPLAPITEEEIPFDIPENWTWCRLGEVIEYTDNLDIQKKLPVDEIINYVDIDAIDNKKYIIREAKVKKVSELSSRARRVLKKNYIIYSTVRPYLRNIAIIEEELNNFIGSTGFVVFKTYRILNKYVFNFLLNPDLNNEFEKTMVGFNSPSISNDTFENTIIPLPPLEIQERIVTKLDELMRNCDKLEEQVKQSQQTNELLLQQVLREALGDKKEKAINKEISVSINKYIEVETNYDALVAETFGEYLPKKVHYINDTNKELAALVYLMNNGLGANYGNVAFQKAVYNSSVITPNLYSKKHDFINHNFGTYSKELANDLNHNPYLTTIKIGTKEVYEIDPSKKNEIVNILSSPENKDFVSSINRLINLYRQPFINKETNKMELLNTVLKINSDLKTTDIEIIYQAMKDWKIKQDKYSTKAEKFSKEDTAMMIELLLRNNILR